MEKKSSNPNTHDVANLSNVCPGELLSYICIYKKFQIFTIYYDFELNRFGQCINKWIIIEKM